MKKIILFIFSFLLFSIVLSPSKVFASQTSSLVPTSDGTYLQWTPSSGSTHYTLVDESSCNGNTDHNRTTVVGERDSYGISVSSVPNNATITQINITPCASRVNNGGTNPVMNVFYRLNGVDGADAGAYPLTGTTPVALSTTSFTGLSTVKDGSTTLEIGAVLTSGTKGAKLSRIATVITYTIPVPTVTTNDATNASSSGAILNSTVNPNGFSTSVYYRYGLVNTSCNLLTSSTSATMIGSGTADVSPNAKNVTSLSSNSTYYFCAIGVNSGGTTFGNVLSFTTLP